MSELLDKMFHAAEKSLRDRIGTKDVMMPIWHVMHADGRSEVIGTPWGNSNEKETVLAALRAMFKTTDVIAYCVSTEAWTMPKGMTPEEAKAIAPNGDINQLRPSVMPNRVECFNVFASDGTASLGKMWNIRRDKRGRVQAIVLRDDLEGSQFGGSIPTMLA